MTNPEHLLHSRPCIPTNNLGVPFEHTVFIFSQQRLPQVVEQPACPPRQHEPAGQRTVTPLLQSCNGQWWHGACGGMWMCELTLQRAEALLQTHRTATPIPLADLFAVSLPALEDCTPVRRAEALNALSAWPDGAGGEQGQERCAPVQMQPTSVTCRRTHGLLVGS